MILLRLNNGFLIWKTIIIIGLHLFGIIKPDYQGNDCWVHRGSYSYSIKRSHGGVNFNTASDICLADNASLASVHSEDENNFLDQLRDDQAVVPVWIGMRRTKYKRRWIDGTDLDYVAPYEAVASINACIYLYRSWYEGNCDNNLFFFCKKEVQDEINAEEHCSLPTSFLRPSTAGIDVYSSIMRDTDWKPFPQKILSTRQSSVMEQTMYLQSSVFQSSESSYISTAKWSDLLESTKLHSITPTVVKSVLPTISKDVFPYSSYYENSMSMSSLVSITNFGASVEIMTAISDISTSKTPITGNHWSEFSAFFPPSLPLSDSSAISQSTFVTEMTENSFDITATIHSNYYTSIMKENSESLSITTLYNISSSNIPKSKTLSILPSSSSTHSEKLRATSVLVIPDSSFSESPLTQSTNIHVSDFTTKATTETPHFDEDAFEKVLEDLRVKKRAKQVAKEAPGGETIGAVAMVILFVIFAGVVLLDLSTIQNHFKLFLRNIKGCREIEEEQNQIELTSL